MSFFSFGNLKLPKTTAIFNFTSTKDCPAKKLGLCHHPKHCYGNKAERLRPNSLPFKAKQTAIWNLLNPVQFAKMFLLEISTLKHKITKFRFSEVGDFPQQTDVDKFTQAAKIITKNGITVYGYSAMRTLDFTELMKTAVVNRQGFMLSNQIKVVDKFSGTADVECPANCNICDACATGGNKIIEIIKH